MEEGHADRAETQRTQIEQLGLQHYLAHQTDGAAGRSPHALPATLLSARPERGRSLSRAVR